MICVTMSPDVVLLDTFTEKVARVESEDLESICDDVFELAMHRISKYKVETVVIASPIARLDITNCTEIQLRQRLVKIYLMIKSRVFK